MKIDRNLSLYLEKLARDEFSFEDWKTRLKKTFEKREPWEKDSKLCRMIMANKMPAYDKKTQQILDLSDDYLISNKLLDNKQFLMSLLTKQDIYFRVRSRLGAMEAQPVKFKAEHLINYTISENKIIDKFNEAIPFWLDDGVGVCYCPWDPADHTAIWKTGKPAYRNIDPLRFWVDFNSTDMYWEDANHFMILEKYGVAEAKKMFPEFEEIISADAPNENHNDAADQYEMFDVYTIQFRRVDYLKMRDMIITESGGYKHTEQLLEEDYIRLMASGQQIDDNIEFSLEPYESKITSWYQWQYSDSREKQLTDPVCIGTDHSFVFLLGYKIPDDPYPRSKTKLQYDMQKAFTVLLNQVLNQIEKMGNPVEGYFSKALKNPADWKQNGWKMNYKVELNEEFLEEHPNLKPIMSFAHDLNPQMFFAAIAMLTGDIKSSAGATDAMTGQMPSAGISGVGLAELKDSAGLYSNYDEMRYEKFVSRGAEKAFTQCCTYMNYEISVPSKDESNNDVPLVISEGEISEIDEEYFFCEPVILSNPTVVKQRNQDRAIQLNVKGKMADIDMYRELDYPDPEGIVARNQMQLGIYEAFVYLQKNPDVLQQILQAAQSQPAENKK